MSPHPSQDKLACLETPSPEEKAKARPFVQQINGVGTDVLLSLLQRRRGTAAGARQGDIAVDEESIVRMLFAPSSEQANSMRLSKQNTLNENRL